MKKYFSDNVKNIPEGKGLFEIYAIATEKERLGEKVIHMEIGRPDFDTPKKIKDAAIKGLNEGGVHYTSFSGLNDLKEAIVERENKKNGLVYDPLSEVVVTVGASEGLYCIWTAFLNPDDEIMIPSPYYSSYTHQLTYSGAKFIKVPIMKDGQMKFNIEDFKSKLTQNTKMILINSPNNPTGYVMTEEDLRMVADFAIENDLIVVSDECYDSYVFQGEFKSISTLPGMKDRTLIVNSTSKTFSMTGWRIGYVIGNPEFIQEIGKIHSHITVCATSFAQAGAVEAYKNVYDEVDVMIEEFKSRKDYVVGRLNNMSRLSFIEPGGAFYVFLNVGELGMNGVEFCEQILIQKGIALAPGSSFGSEWDNYVRLAYTCSMEDIVEAMDLIEEFIEK